MPHSLQDLDSLTRDNREFPAVEAWSPNHWTTREVPNIFYQCWTSHKWRHIVCILSCMISFPQFTFFLLRIINTLPNCHLFLLHLLFWINFNDSHRLQVHTSEWSCVYVFKTRKSLPVIYWNVTEPVPFGYHKAVSSWISQESRLSVFQAVCLCISCHIIQMFLGGLSNT